MKAPSSQQLRILRFMAAGLELRPADRTQAHLVLNGKIAAIVRAHSVRTMRDAGWLIPRTDETRYELTDAGRAQAEVHTFVRAFAQSVEVG